MTRITRSAAFASIVVAVAVALAGCGGRTFTSESTTRPASAYCTMLEEHRATLDAVDNPTQAASFEQMVADLRSIARIAPAEVREDWTTLAERANAVLRALDDAGLGIEDLFNYEQWSKVPLEKQWPLKDAMATFTNATDERNALVKNVKDECGIALSWDS